MKIIRFPLGSMQANCYFLIDDDECIIIDPADEASFILEELQRRKLKLLGMLATHGHFDHLMAAGEIQLSLKVPLFISEKDKFLIDRLQETADHFLGYKTNIIKPTIVKDICKIACPSKPEGRSGENCKLKIIPSPGHTPGSVCFYLPAEVSTKAGFKSPILFSGDTIFKDGIGRYDFSYSSKIDLDKSIKRILSLPPKTIVYPGHGEDTTINEAKSKMYI